MSAVKEMLVVKGVINAVDKGYSWFRFNRPGKGKAIRLR